VRRKKFICSKNKEEKAESEMTLPPLSMRSYMAQSIPRKALATNADVWARLTFSAGLYVPSAYPVVIPSSYIFWTYMNAQCSDGTSLKYGVGVYGKLPGNLALMINAAI